MKFSGKVHNLNDLKHLVQIITPLLQPNFYLILQGKLGVGKTTLVQLIAKKLGISEKITSPTFSICHRYRIKNNYYLNHFDFFRLNEQENLDFLQELTIDNLNIIEWGEKNTQFYQGRKFLHINLIKESNSETRIVIMNIPFTFPFSQQKKILNFFSEKHIPNIA